MTAKPASHPQSNFTDKLSVSLVESILSSHARVISDISSVDKWPNRDGHLDIQDETGALVGTLAVQVKTLENSDTLKLSCPVSFLAYCDEVEPCLLLVADNEGKKVYWKYIDTVALKDIDYKSNKKTKAITLDESQYLSEDEKGYIDSWTLIVENNKRRIQGYDDLEYAYEKLRDSANELVGVEDEKHIHIHQFLDELNKNYDHNFPTTKKFFYSDTWKIGMAYEAYEANSLMYALYPIGWNKNDVLIKKIDAKFTKESQYRGLRFTGHFRENPVAENPVEYARKVTSSTAQKLINAKLLDHAGNEILAREIVFAFMDRFYEQMGFTEPLDEYGAQFILHGFYNYMPLWIDEAYSLMRKENRNNVDEQLRRKGYYDPGIIWQITSEERTHIHKNVSQRMGKASVSLNIASSDHDIGVFLESLQYLNDSNLPIKRVYKRPDNTRLRGKTGSIWGVFSEKAATHNMKIIFDNLEAAYNTVIENNFPGLRSELSLLNDANEIAVYYDLSEDSSATRLGPTYRKYHLKHNNTTPRRSVRVIDKSEMENLEKILRNTDGKNTGHTQIQIVTHSRLVFLYSKTPLLSILYDILENRFKDYLAKV